MEYTLTVIHQIEFNPYTLDTAEPILELHKKHNITTASYGGLLPITQFKGGPLDLVLTEIRMRLTKDSGTEVNDGQVLTKWLEARSVIQVTSVDPKWNSYSRTLTDYYNLVPPRKRTA